MDFVDGFHLLHHIKLDAARVQSYHLRRHIEADGTRVVHAISTDCFKYSGLRLELPCNTKAFESWGQLKHEGLIRTSLFVVACYNYGTRGFWYARSTSADACDVH